MSRMTILLPCKNRLDRIDAGELPVIVKTMLRAIAAYVSLEKGRLMFIIN